MADETYNIAITALTEYGAALRSRLARERIFADIAAECERLDATYVGGMHGDRQSLSHYRDRYGIYYSLNFDPSRICARDALVKLGVLVCTEIESLDRKAANG